MLQKLRTVISTHNAISSEATGENPFLISSMTGWLPVRMIDFRVFFQMMKTQSPEAAEQVNSELFRNYKGRSEQEIQADYFKTIKIGP
jgi:hypothetical protein